MAPSDVPGPKPSRPLMILRQAEDFQRVLAQPWLAKSAHFAVHFLAPPSGGDGQSGTSKDLSSTASSDGSGSVDNSLNKSVDKPWIGALKTPDSGFGLVVPKRLARRAVTRNLLKRQIRQVLAERHAATRQGLPPGAWVLRLRHGFDRAQFPSAASGALRQVARAELLTLVEQAATRAQSVRETSQP